MTEFWRDVLEHLPRSIGASIQWTTILAIYMEYSDHIVEFQFPP